MSKLVSEGLNYSSAICKIAESRNQLRSLQCCRSVMSFSPEMLPWKRGVQMLRSSLKDSTAP